MSTHTRVAGADTAALSGLINRALTRFHSMTGLEAVATVGQAPSASGVMLTPPLHPRCAARIRGAASTPCEAEWRKHLSHLEEKACSHQHLCRLRLRCGCVPVVYGNRVVGLVKCVCGSGVSPKKFTASIELLEVLVAGSSRELELLQLRQQVGVLERAVELDERFEIIESAVAVTKQNGAPKQNGNRLIVEILDYLEAHYRDPDLELAQVAAGVGRSEKYIAHLFAVSVGTRMRSYIINLRLCHARDLLLGTPRTIEEIAADTGFTNVARFREAFRRSIGVTPSRYREVFGPRSS